MAFYNNMNSEVKMEQATVEKSMGGAMVKLGLGKKRPTTINEATASLQQNIDDLKYVYTTREAAATMKAKKIEALRQEKADDEKEAKGASKLATKLENFLHGDDE